MTLPAGLRCRWCPHTWHGLPCREDMCHCESTLNARDDTWRPRITATPVDRARTLMHDTGIDGYVATAAIRYADRMKRSPFRITAALYGRAA